MTRLNFVPSLGISRQRLWCLFLWLTASKMSPNPRLLVLTALCHLPSLSVVWVGSSDTRNKFDMAKSDGISLVRRDYKKALASILLPLSLTLPGSLWRKPADLLGAALWRGPSGKELMSLPSSQWRREAYQRLCEWSWRWIFWGLPTATWVTLEVGSPLVRPRDKVS